MPGIVGLITRMPRALAEAELEVMVRAMSREPFYATGMWMDESLGVYVGWTVRRNAFADGMPLFDERGAVLVFSGEEYSRSGPASRRLDLVEQAGSPAALNGRFHGLLADRSRRAVTLFNDRYGMHRLYYHESPDAFYFAAEAKAILEVRPELRSADPRSVGEFIACGCVLENRTIFKDVFVLPPGAGCCWAGVTQPETPAAARPETMRLRRCIQGSRPDRITRADFAIMFGAGLGLRG